MAPRVAWISVAPVKGLALMSREVVSLEPFGVRENRRFHLIGEDGRLLNGKQLAPFVQIKPDWDEDAGTLALRFPNGGVVAGDVELGETVSTNFYGRRMVDGRLVAGPWAEAISEFVGKPVRLVQPVEAGAGNDRGKGAVSLLSTASLEALRAAGGVKEPIDARRFRMLFGVEGVEPYEEDSWVGRRVRIGEAEVEVEGNVGRCLVTSRHPDNGSRNLSTLDMLAEQRGGVETTEPLPFGVWASVAKPGIVRLGDPIHA